MRHLTPFGLYNIKLVEIEIRIREGVGGASTAGRAERGDKAGAGRGRGGRRGRRERNAHGALRGHARIRLRGAGLPTLARATPAIAKRIDLLLLLLHRPGVLLRARCRGRELAHRAVAGVGGEHAAARAGGAPRGDDVTILQREKLADLGVSEVAEALSLR